MVTGAGRRVGRAIAIALAREGYAIAVHYNASESGARETVSAIEAEGGAAAMLRADLMDVSQVERLADEVATEQGRVDLLVNSAAVMTRTPIGELTVTQWDDMTALNVRAPLFLSQRLAPALRAVHGNIVNIADLAAFETWPAYVPHSMTKAAIVQLTRGLAHALAPEIRVNAVAPGVVMLPEGWDERQAEHLRCTTPLRRLGSADDVAGAVVYLAGAAYVTGETLLVDGGRHIRR